MGYFPYPAKGIHADLVRHTEIEKKLVALVAAYEGKDDDMSLAALKAFNGLLSKLRASKAEVVAQIGRKRMSMRLRSSK